MALSHDIDLIEIEEVEKNVCVPQNMQEPALALQSALYGNVFVDLVLSHKKLLPSIL
jgi:hypothetical protein